MNDQNQEITIMAKVTKKRAILIISLIIIIAIGTIGYYIYCQNRPSKYKETETLYSYTENYLKEDAEEILEKILLTSKQYLNGGSISYEYSKGRHDIDKDVNVLTYNILYNNKQTSLSLDFETVDGVDITKITFNANTGYTTISLEEESIFLTDKKTYSDIIVCLLVCLPQSIDEAAFQNTNLVNLYEELYEKEQIRTCGYDISVRKYTNSIIDYSFEKIKFTMK